MSENVEPGTREEAILSAINRQLDGESVDTSALIEPGDRKETYLREIAQKIGSGGGGLPPVTASDNGKALRVVSGDWAAAEAELPGVTAADDYKVLTALNGDWGKAPASFTIVYTITGEPVGNVYPLSTDATCAGILDALNKGANVRASISLGGNTAFLCPSGTREGYVAFSTVLYMDGGWKIAAIDHNSEENCHGYIIPLAVSE